MKVIAAMFFALLITGCNKYNREVATEQHGRAVTTYPEIGAQYCKDKFPPQQIVTSDTVTKTDTIFQGNDIDFGDDSVRVHDTVYITKKVPVPGPTIRKTVTIRDTIKQVNTAEVEYWKLQANKAIDIATDKEEEAKAAKELAASWKKKARKRQWMLIGLGVASLLGLFLIIRRKAAKKVLP